MKEMMQALKSFWADEEGATVVEYGVLVALIIVALLVVITALSGGVWEAFSSAATHMDTGAVVGTKPQ